MTELASRLANPATRRPSAWVSRERALSRFLAEHHQAVSSRELGRLGFEADDVLRLCRRRRILRAYQGVYRCGSVPLAGDTALRCALLAAGDGSALTGDTGSWVLGHLSYEPRAIQCVLEGDPGRMRRGGLRIRRVETLPESDVMLVRGMRCTTPERTLLEFAGSIGSAKSNPRWEYDHRALRRALREAVGADHDLPRRLERRLADRKGHRGTRILRLLLDEHRANPGVLRSNFEADFFAWCAEIGLPPWETNAIVAGAERDVVWHDDRVVAELDTFRHHGDYRRFEGDRQRGNELVAAGWTSLRITDTRFYTRRHEIKDELFAALGLD